MKNVSSALTLLLLFVALTSCTKSQIKNNCENNKISVSPNDYDTDSVLIYIPSAFTPDGDLLNDRFRPFIWGMEITNYEVSKGNKTLFSVSNIGKALTSENSWDGTDEDGELCKDGVYSYEVKGKNDIDGDFTITGEVSLITEQNNKPCECRYEDQLDPTEGFISPSAEACTSD